MFPKNVIRKLATALPLLSVVALVLTGCGLRDGRSLDDITDNSNQNQQQQQQQQQQPPPQNNVPSTNNNNGGNEVNVPVQSNLVNFTNINLYGGGEPPLQRREGIYYFTKSRVPTELPQELVQAFQFDTHNGWLIQLDDAIYKGHKVKVQQIKRSGTIYDITVKLEPGGDITKPAYGFFRVGILDMPTSAQFRIFNENGRKLWPKF